MLALLQKKTHCAVPSPPPRSGGRCVPAPLFRRQSEVFVWDCPASPPTRADAASCPLNAHVQQLLEDCPQWLTRWEGRVWSPSWVERRGLIYMMTTATGSFHVGRWADSKEAVCALRRVRNAIVHNTFHVYWLMWGHFILSWYSQTPATSVLNAINHKQRWFMESSEWHYVFYISVMPTVIQASGNRLMKHPDVLGYLIQCVYQKQTEPSPGFISRLILYQISRECL